MSGDNANQDPIAQGADAEVQTEVVETEAQNGIQKRFDELTRRAHEAERNAQLQAAQYQAQLQQMQAQQQELLGAVIARQQNHEPEVEFEPEERKKFAAALNPIQRQLEQQQRQFQQVVSNMELQFAQQQIASEAAAKGLPPEVSARATELLRDWKAKGLAVANAQDALRYAAGEALFKGTAQAQVSQAQRQEFNAQPQGLFGSAAPAPRQQAGRKPRPANFDSLPPEEKVRILEADGVDDRQW